MNNEIKTLTNRLARRDNRITRLEADLVRAKRDFENLAAYNTKLLEENRVGLAKITGSCANCDHNEVCHKKLAWSSRRVDKGLEYCSLWEGK